MKILVELTYYRPHTSGLTIFAERLAKALASRGHHITVLTSQFDPGLRANEFQDGVHIVRVPVLARISKGVIMPKIGWMATCLIRQHDVIHLHLPQFDAAGFAFRGRLFKVPSVITYHCDLKMPQGVLSQTANHVVTLMNYLAVFFSHKLVTYTQDYADHSNLMQRFKRKTVIIDPPVMCPDITQLESYEFLQALLPGEKRSPLIGMAARFATEKGVEVLVSAMKKILAFYPQAQVWFAGLYKNIIGEMSYYERLQPEIQKLESGGNWKFLGLLDERQMTAFYRNIDVLVIPSLNSTEAFGLVQIEAMMNGVPVIASDLPGVRQPVLRHGMGEIVPVGDSVALAESIIKVIENKDNFKVPRKRLIQQYSPSRIAEHYEALFAGLIAENYPRK